MCKNLRKTLRETMWENGGKFSSFLLICTVYDVTLWNMFGFHKIVHIIFNTFYTKHLFGYNLLYRGFTQFPHSLLLLLQN